MIVKPLDGRGGEGIFHVHEDDRNLVSILEQSDRASAPDPIMAQRYLPDVAPGRQAHPAPRRRAARRRAAGSRRARGAGPTSTSAAASAKADSTSADRRIVERVAPSLRRDGLFFVGIDVIGGCLTEINVTSPTGVQEINRLAGETRSLEG